MERYKRHPNTKCLVCEKLIYKRPFELKRNEGKAFCSMKCYGIHNRNENPCVICGKPILASLHKKTCSRACSNKNRSGIRYKIGRPKDKANIFRVLKLKLLKDKNLCCERCNYNNSVILQIHHKNRKRNDNSMSNLEILCPNCHYEEHYQEKSWIKKH